MSQRGELGAITKSLNEVMCDLKSWSKDKFGAITRELESLRKKLEELRAANTEEAR